MIGSCLSMAKAQTWTKEQFLSFFGKDSAGSLEYGHGLKDWNQIKNLKELGKDSVIKRKILDLLNINNIIEYEIKKAQLSYITYNTEKYLRQKVEDFLRLRGIYNKRDSIFSHPDLYKKYFDTVLYKKNIEIRKEISKSNFNLSPNNILLNGYLGYKESYDSLKKWLHFTPKYVDRLSVIMALAHMGDKEGISCYSQYIDTSIANANRDSVSYDNMNETFFMPGHLHYINQKENWLDFLKIFNLKTRYNEYGYPWTRDVRYYLLKGRIGNKYGSTEDKQIWEYWDKLSKDVYNTKRFFTDAELLPIKEWFKKNIDQFIN